MTRRNEVGTKQWTAQLGLALLVASCARFPGQPAAGDEVSDPRRVVSFEALYSANCAGCHGAQGSGGAALGLAVPGYLAIVSDAELRRVIAEGRRNTPMPAFAESAGGMLRNAQVDALVAGIRAWAPANSTHDPQTPRYPASAAGDPERGAHVFLEHCGSCHGADGRGSASMGSIVDGAFLALISPQLLATTMIAGRPDLGCPDWRGPGGGAPMTTENISDALAWLLGQRPSFPGQPYPSAIADGRKL